MPDQHPWRLSRSQLVTLVVFLVAALAAGALVWRLEYGRVQRERARVADLSGDQVHILQRSIERSMSATYALASLVRQGHGEVPNFEAVAQQMLRFYPGTSLGLAPQGVVSILVPRAGNEAALGLDLLNDPARAKEARLARDSGELTLAGPFELVQGGLGAVGRLPVFLDDAQGQPVFWGFAMVILHFPEALDPVQLSRLSSRGFDYELWRPEPHTGDKQVIAASSTHPLQSPVERTLPVPNGTWTLSVSPVRGWGDPVGLALNAGLGLLFAVLMAYLAKLVVEARAYRQRLEALVAERTAQIKAREADLNRAQAIARVGSWVYDLNHGQMHWSEETYRIFGVDPEVRPEFTGFLKQVPPEDQEAVTQAWQGVLQGIPCDLEHRVLVDHTIRWVREQAEPGIERNLDGTLKRCVGTTQDITERKQAEESLSRALAKYKTLFDAFPLGITVADETGRILETNPIAEAILGTPSSRHTQLRIGDPEWHMIRPDGTPMPAEEFASVRALHEKRLVSNVEMGVVKPNGETAWLRVTAAPLPPEGSGVVIAYSDVTERKQLEDALLFLSRCGTPATGEDFFESLACYLATSLGVDYVCIDRLQGDGLAAQTVAVYFDGKLEANVEYALKDTPCGEVVGKTVCCFERNVCELFPKDAVLQEMRAQSYVGTTLWSSTGQPIGLLAIIGRQPLANAKLAESMLQLVAVRAAGELERRAAEEELRRAKEEADRANRAKDEFLAKLSHELRTPLTPVLLATEQWEAQEDLPAATREDLAMVRRNLELEARLLEDLLDLSRILNGKMPLRRESLDVHRKVVEALAIVASDIQAKGLQLRVDLQATRVWIDGDSARVQQAIWNLLSNAIKFSTEGSALTVNTANDAQGHVLVQVTDSGIGIAPEILPRLFHPFEQGSQQTTRQFGGLGLGLTICKSVMEMHGGSIAAHSPGPGKGATFTLCFPTVTDVAPVATPSGSPALQPAGPHECRRVLLVEDHSDTGKLMSRLLSGWGYKVRVAQSMALALEAANEPFDLLISDLGLPDGNGHDLMRQLSARGPLAAIAVSGYGTEEDVRRSREAGFAEHLTKPLSPAALRAAIRRVEADGSAGIQAGKSDHSATAPS